jgi:hypothetical protein
MAVFSNLALLCDTNVAAWLGGLPNQATKVSLEVEVKF